MPKGLSLSAKLYLGFFSVVGIVIGLGGFAIIDLSHVSESSKVISGSIPGISLSCQIEDLARNNIFLVTKHILSSNEAERAQVAGRIGENKALLTETLEKYEKATTQSADRELFQKMKSAREVWVKILVGEILAYSKAGKPEFAKEALVLRGEPAFNAFMATISETVKYNRDLATAAGMETMDASRQTKTGILIGVAISTILAAFIGIYLSRTITSALSKVIASLTDGSEQVSSASSQISQSSQQMAEGASEQASSLEETSASLEELSSMTKQNSDNAKQANLMVNDTREAVEKSRAAMDRMSQAIGQIKNSSDQTAKIVKTIDEIAFQTNLLALNAAVEAARAGDAGKGFAVVAEEVCNLAQRSAEAAKNTSSLIEQSQKNADNGVSVSQEVAAILASIVASVSKLSQLIGEVSSASQEQTKGIEQIGMAVSEMDKLTQSNAATAEESASASEELSAQANELNDMVNVLVAIVSGSASGTRTAPAALGKTASSVSRTGSNSAGPKARPKPDWSPAPAPASRKNGYAPAARVAVKSAHAEAVIPLSDDESNDF
ncbi:MAG: methyl-accepting chemotaxis protein [Fibrobacteria bacterium]